MLVVSDPKDQRARGLFLYHAASTGRWGGKLIQPQNFPRGEIPDVESYIEDILKERYDYISMFAHPIVVASSLLRSMLCAPPGRDLMAADFAAIECRIVNWLAGQDDVVEHFRRLDAGDGDHNPYKIMAVRMGRGASVGDIKKPSEDYQAGKAAELGCGFGMGAKKYVSAAWDVHQLRVTEAEALAAVKIYRATHAHVKNFWYETEAACIRAIQNPGEICTFGAAARLRVLVAGAYMYLMLPSGRPLVYAAPRIVQVETPWSREAREEAMISRALGEKVDIPPVQMKAQIEFYGVDQETKQWVRQRTYGGHLVENIVQAVARDLLAEAMLRQDAKGRQVVLHSHDELVVEVSRSDTLSVAGFCSEVAEVPAWGLGCPIAAEGWRGTRYRK
jgi:DNA polymerase